MKPVIALLCALAATSANAGAAPPLADYRETFEACRDAAGASRLALRRMTLAGAATLLLVDPDSLRTELAAAARWRCAATSDDAQKDTRLMRAVRAGMEAERGLSLNAGLTHGAGGGAFVTADLCPSRRPLDRGFFESLARDGQGTPVAVAVSGLWMRRHGADFDWLKGLGASGALRIAWVDHSFSHPYSPRRPDASNYLLSAGVDIGREILATEQELIARGATPSVFFRFPGLVADSGLTAAVRARHLVALGADGWMVFAPPLRPGTILLVHPNGNEPAGLRLFAHKLNAGALPRPFRPIEEAP
jgi:hypothetical protein